MSEKNDPAGRSDAQRDVDSFADEPGPFRLSSIGPDGKPTNPSRGQGTGGGSSASRPPDLLDASGEPAVPPEGPAEIDAGIQELQARPADVGPARHFPDPPKTIVSERPPAWPTWSDGGLPPLIIYGPTPTTAVPEEREPDLMVPDTSSDLGPAVEEPLTHDVQSAGHESADRYETFARDEGSIGDAPIAAPIQPPEWNAPTLPVESTVPQQPEELDEIFESIDEIAGESPAPTPPYDAAADSGASEAAGRDDLPVDLPAEDRLLDDAATVPADERVDEPADRPAAFPPTLMGTVPDFSAYDLQASAGEATDEPALPAEAAPLSAGPESEAFDGFEPVTSAPAAEPPAGDAPQTDDASPLEWEPASSPETKMEGLETPPAVEPELALSASDLMENNEPVPVEPVMTTAVEPSPIELAAIPEEPSDAVPLTAAAAAAANAAELHDHDASHGQTATEFFAHAHADVEHRRGVLSLGLLTRLAGLGGLLAGTAAMAILILACAGFGELSESTIPLGRYYLQHGSLYMGGLAVLLAIGAIFWKSWWPSAVMAAVTAIAMGLGWFGLERYHERVDGFSLLSISPWITYVGLGGIVLAILAGLIEHRRLREETAVLAALFSNVLAAASGGVLWMLWLGLPLFIK